MARQEGLYYVALGGAGEIGMNLYLYGYGSQNDRRWIAVDCGIGFPDEAHAPGVEVMTPDISFLKREAGRLDALFITHAHEDHIGALEYLWPELKCPIYAGKFAAAIGRGKLSEGFALDLFASAGAGPDETLREISGPGGAPYEADYDSPWWSAFWRHCVAGEKGRRFLLSRRVRAFVLDSSVLDGSAFLAEDAR